MAITTYLRLNTDKFGKVKGGVAEKGHEGDIAVIAIEHGIISPRDAASGQATGKRQHQPLSFLKETDMASPILNTILVQNAVIKTAEFFFYGAVQPGRLGGMTGMEKNIYTIILQNAFIAKMDFTMQNNRETEGNYVSLKERISLVYERIEWKWTDGGINAIDEWKAPS